MPLTHIPCSTHSAIWLFPSPTLYNTLLGVNTVLTVSCPSRDKPEEGLPHRFTASPSEIQGENLGFVTGFEPLTHGDLHELGVVSIRILSCERKPPTYLVSEY